MLLLIKYIHRIILNKSFLFFLSFLFFAPIILAQQLMIDHIGKNTIFTVIIPANIISGSFIGTSDLLICCQISKGTDLLFNSSDIMALNFVRNDQGNLFYQFTTELKSGQYDFSLKIENRKVGKRFIKKYYITVPARNNYVSNLYISYENNNNTYYPSGKEWINDSKTINIKMYLEKKPSQIKYYYTNNRFITILPTVFINYQLPDSLKQYDLSKSFIELFIGNISIKRQFELFSTKLLFNQRYSLKDQIQQLRIIMSQNEYDKVRQYSEKDWPQIIEAFWKNHDPNPITEENEFRDLIYQRILESDEKYTIRSYKAGWQTDRGKILIKYGYPDDIQIENYLVGQYPVEIWTYYNLDKKFHFDDKKGFGNYELRDAWKFE